MMSNGLVMFSRFTQALMALLMAVPLCWCCVAPAMTARAEEAECHACKKFATAEREIEAPRLPESKKDCPCCTQTLQRNLSPDPAAAPRLVLVDLQAWVWMREELFALSALPIRDGTVAAASDYRLRRGRETVPLYLRHCAWLT